MILNLCAVIARWTTDLGYKETVRKEKLNIPPNLIPVMIFFFNYGLCHL